MKRSHQPANQKIPPFDEDKDRILNGSDNCRAPILANGATTALIQWNKLGRLPVKYLSLPLATSAQKIITGGNAKGATAAKMTEGLLAPRLASEAYWKSFRIDCVDWLAIESDCTPSCCCTCSAWSRVDATFKSASTSEPTPLLSEVCKLSTKED